MNDSGDYYTTIDQRHRETPEPITPLIVCPKCKGGLKEIHNLKTDGTRKKNDKIIELQCIKCGRLVSETKQPQWSM